MLKAGDGNLPPIEQRPVRNLSAGHPPPYGVSFYKALLFEKGKLTVTNSEHLKGFLGQPVVIAG